MTGRATVAHCDLLVAVWDGLPPRGRGGTGEVVQLAITRGTRSSMCRLPRKHPLASFGALSTQRDHARRSSPAPSGRSIATHGRDAPRAADAPAERQEQDCLKRFTRERLRHIRTRIEYPLLLAAAGVNRFGAKDFANKHAEAEIRDEWRRYRQGCADPLQISAPMDMLEEAYSWADRFGTHFAQTYRSGHIFNFVLGGFAVCLGLSAFMAPHLKFEFAALELVITLAIILNATIGSRNEWHRRWLDYRQLAERLRPMRSLKLLGVAAPDPPGTSTNPVPRRWIDWYGAGSGGRWAAPPVRSTPRAPPVSPRRSPSSRSRRRSVITSATPSDRDARPQTGMDRQPVVRGDFGRVDRNVLPASRSDCSREPLRDWSTLVSAGFPALGTAVFGINLQGDFGGDALRRRDDRHAGQIGRSCARRQPVARADLTEQAGRIMLGDLDEWRLVNQQHTLAVAERQGCGGVVPT